MSNKIRPVNVAAHTRDKRQQEDAKIVKVSTAMLGHVGPEATAKLIESAVADTEAFLRSWESLKH